MISCKLLKYIFIIGGFLLAFLPNQVFSAENLEELPEVVVTANKVTEPLKQTTSEITVITKEDLEKMNVDWVVDALRKLPDVYVKQSGGAGKQASVFLNTSAKSGHILVMIDGIKVNSPTTGDFDFSSLSVDEIERIEIINGPQSTLYGSEAVAGVINIITKKGKGKPKITLSLEGGSYGTYKPAFNLSGGTNKLNYRVTAFYYKIDGFSDYADGKEKDGYKQAFVSGRFGFRPFEKLEFEFSGRYFYHRSELDFGTENGLTLYQDDPDYIMRKHHLLISGKAKLEVTPNWKQTFTVSRVKEILNTKDPDDVFKYYSSKITPAIYIVDWQNNFDLADSLFLVTGVEYRKEKGKYESSSSYDEDVENKAVYLNVILKPLHSNIVLNAGARYDNHQTFGKKTTYRVSFLYNLKPYSLRVKGSYGTAFKAPTLNDLFWPDTGWSKGNPELKPEESWGWIIGAEKDFLKGRATLSLSSFYQKYRNLIEWVEVIPWVYQPQNVEKASIKGFKLGLNLLLTPDFKIKTGYTYLDAQNKSTGKYLIYKPDHKLSITGEYRISKLLLFVDYTHTGRRYTDSDNQNRLKSYSLLNLCATYRLNFNLSFFLRVNNVLNNDYKEVKDYDIPDRSFYAGVRFLY